MTAAIANSHGLESIVTPSVLEDMVWNLQTWPLDLVEWPTHNSHRMVCVWDGGMKQEGLSCRSLSIAVRDGGGRTVVDLACVCEA